MSELLAAFPDASVASIVKRGRKQVYQTPDGDMNRCTTILEALPKPFLVPWAANLEHQVVLEAAAEAYAEGVEGGVNEFVAAIESRLGAARAHQKKLSEAAEIGSRIHEEIQRRTRAMLGFSVGPELMLPDGATLAVMAWEDWFKTAGLKPFRCEQVVWDARTRTAGTIDLLAFDASGQLGIVDYKSSKGIYDSHHVQVAKYAQMARNFAEIHWSRIVRLPKALDDTFFTTLGSPFDVKELGELYDRRLTEEQLIGVFEAARTVYEHLIAKAP